MDWSDAASHPWPLSSLLHQLRLQRATARPCRAGGLDMQVLAGALDARPEPRLRLERVGPYPPAHPAAPRPNPGGMV